MLLSFALILIIGYFAGQLCKKLQLPALMGMILCGILMGPFALSLIDDSVLNISAQIRKIALIIILIRGGLSLKLEDLKKVGRPAILMCFVPACFEMLGMVLLAPRLLPVSVVEAAVLGAVIAAVSPAVIVPKMIKLMEEGYGTAQSIPQMILAGASVDDVFVIVMFSAFTSLASGETVSATSFLTIPVSILLGIVAGLLLGQVLYLFYEKIELTTTMQGVFLLCLAFLLVSFEDAVPMIPFASLLAVMFVGIRIKQQDHALAAQLSGLFNRLWSVAEIFLFVLVGATVDPHYIKAAGLSCLLLLLGVLCFRMLGVFLCMLKTPLSQKERLFCMIAYTPKATVQAAIGGVPLAMGLNCGNIVLAVAVVAILFTAPAGAFAIEHSYRRLLKKA